MDRLLGIDFLWTPEVVAALAFLAIAAVWLAFAPSRPQGDVAERLNDYLERGDVIVDQEMQRSFGARALWPALRGVLRLLGRFLPNKSAEKLRQQLEEAGRPGGLTPIDFYGIRLLSLVLLSVLGFAIGAKQGQAFVDGLRFAAGGAVLGYLLPLMWLRSKIRSRRQSIEKSLPDALDMLTIGVEAGLAFESAMIRVGEKWNNALSREFTRAVAEMRVGASREVALARMAGRCGVEDLSTFVAVLVQSTQLGVSIAQVLHGQAAAMRLRRRQRAEEKARQAGIKMLIPLILFVFPALFVVILGPSVPMIQQVMGAMTGTGGR